MAKLVPGETPSIRQDVYTERLLACFIQLVAKAAINKKNEFTELIGDEKPMSLQQFSSLEVRRRNYPKDEQRRKAVGKRLFETFGINPQYLEGKTEQMFLFEPVPIKLTETLKHIPVEIHYRRRKVQLLDEIEALKKEVEHYKKEVEHYKKLYEESQAEKNNLNSRKK
jgi:hypothetical protein